MKMKSIKIYAFFCFLILTTSIAAQTQPSARVDNVTDEYFGVKVADPYRWMENEKSPEFVGFLKGQADYARATLDKLPLRKELLERIAKLDAAAPSLPFAVQRLDAGDKYVYLKQPPDAQAAKLYWREGLTGAEILLVDPDKFKSATESYTISYFVPSPDGKYIVYGIAANGSEKPVLHVLDTATRKDLPDVIERSDWEYARPEWRLDSRSFFYSKMQDLPANAPATEIQKKKQVFLHVLGTEQKADRFIIGFGAANNVAIDEADTPIILTLTHTPSPFVILRIKHGDASEETVYRAPIADIEKPNIKWEKVFDRTDLVKQFIVHEDALYLLTSKDAPRFKLIKTSVSKPNLERAETIIPASEALIDGINPALDALYVSQMRSGLDETVRVEWKANAKPERIIAPNAPACFVSGTNHLLNGAFISSTAWTGNGLTYLYDPKTKTFTDTGFQQKNPLETEANLESREVQVKAADGAMIPLSIIYKKGLKLDGQNPTLLTGYGAYGTIQYPFFDPSQIPWFERGGVIAVAHVRGGGENGEEWHTAGQKLNKPNTWKDFIACAEYLIKEKYTAPAHLAGRAGSAGGILIGRAITERPDLFGAAVINVGILDTLRFETTANGVPNIQEFGSTKTADGFKGLFEMSAFHHVKDGTKYPAVLLTTGANDRRVDVWQSAKMAARLRKATTSGKPVLLSVDYNAGHGAGAGRTQYHEQLADFYAFLFEQLK